MGRETEKGISTVAVKKRRVIQRQRPIKGGRDPLPACVIHAIREKVQNIADRHGVSRSFVIAVALAEAFGISEQEKYR
jgi:hypothetical protein